MEKFNLKGWQIEAAEIIEKEPDGKIYWFYSPKPCGKTYFANYLVNKYPAKLLYFNLRYFDLMVSLGAFEFENKSDDSDPNKSIALAIENEMDETILNEKLYQDIIKFRNKHPTCYMVIICPYPPTNLNEKFKDSFVIKELSEFDI